MRVNRRGQSDRFEDAAVALRVKCRCGKSLKISSALADRRLACPHCKHPFRIPAAKFRAAEGQAAGRAGATSGPAAGTKQAAVTSPRRATHTATRQPAASAAAASASAAGHAAARADPLPASLDDELLGELSGEFEHSQTDLLGELEREASSAQTSAAPPAVPIEVETAQTMSYARDPRREKVPGSRLGDAVQGPKRGFWADAFMSLIYPVMSGGNAITMLIILAIGAVGEVLPGFGCFALIGVLIIFGWFAALYLSVIQETSTGSDELPGIRMEDGFLDDIVFPAFKYIGAFAMAIAPSAILGILMVSGVAPQSWGVMLPFWLAAGIFLLPTSLLLFALDSYSMLLRLDLIFTTIFNTFLPYLAMWLMLLIVGVASLMTSAGALILSFVMPDLAIVNSLQAMSLSVGGSIFISLVGIYLNIVSMRIIGLYYLHFKHRFTIKLE